MKLTVKDITGKASGEYEVKFATIDNGSGTQAVHDVVIAYRNAQRSGTASTKTMGEVQGTGKKPWRQKGTGRARAGSFASPLWCGGGVTFGPKPRDFSVRTNSKVRKLALRKALSARLHAGDVIVVNDLKLGSGKTKEFASVLEALDVIGTALVVTDEANQNLSLASRNLMGVGLVSSADLNTYETLKYDKVVITKGALDKLDQRLA